MDYAYSQLQNAEDDPNLKRILSLPRQGLIMNKSSNPQPNNHTTADELLAEDSLAEAFWTTIFTKGLHTVFAILLCIIMIFVVLIMSICAIILLVGAWTPPDFEETLILVSLDSFRPDYLDWYPESTKTLQRIKNEGVSAQNLISVFPSKTFPNHYTIATGLYPEHHGIVSNVMKDPSRPGEVFHINEPIGKDPFWWGGEPLWVTAESQGIRSGAVYWIGSEVMIKGFRPTYYEKYNQSLPSSSRIDHALNYLNPKIDKKPRLILIYLDIVDTVAHNFYLYNNQLPNNNEKLRAAIQEVDGALAKLIQNLEKIGIWGANKVNLVVLSDHGMAPTPANKIINVDQLVKNDFSFENCLEHLNYGPILDLWVKEGCKNIKPQILNSLKTKVPNSKTYAKEEIPEKFHYRNNPRIPEILVLADEEYSLSTTTLNYNLQGEHGYDHELASMRGIFMARGPAFKSGGVVYEPFQNIHIYNMLSKVLNLKPAPNDGNLDVVKSLLK